ncbi:hypothetical protein [Bacillus infantis]|uniref:hypothetical protein n=1 Tax=Bacillus infantis TaxID=324767 RepID=UPI003CEBA4FD
MIAGLILWFGIITAPLLLASISLFKDKQYAFGFIIFMTAFVLGIVPLAPIIIENEIAGSIVAVVSVWGFFISLALDEKKHAKGSE